MKQFQYFTSGSLIYETQEAYEGYSQGVFAGHSYLYKQRCGRTICARTETFILFDLRLLPLLALAQDTTGLLGIILLIFAKVSRLENMAILPRDLRHKAVARVLRARLTYASPRRMPPSLKSLCPEKGSHRMQDS